MDNYYVTFIDDHSQKTWIHFLKNKESEEVLRKFKEFKAQVNNPSRRRTKILRLDNGGELTSIEFNYFWKEVGIKRELTVPYNPQENGVEERKNQTIVLEAKSMIHEKILLMFLW